MALTQRQRRVLWALNESEGRRRAVSGLVEAGLLPNSHFGPTLLSLYRRQMIDGEELIINSSWSDHTNWWITDLGRECLAEDRVAPITLDTRGRKLTT